MRLTIFLFLVSIFSIQASSYSQKKKISLDLNNVKISEVLEKIENKSKFKFVYNNDEIDAEKIVSVKEKNVSIKNILQKLFDGLPVSIVQRNELIIIDRISDKSEDQDNDEPESTDGDIKKQDPLVTGQVTDSNGQPLPGANIVEKGTNNGVQTDFDGKFSLEVNSLEAVLIVSFISYETQEIPLNGKSNVNIVLKESSASLDEVVLVGYGTQRKVNVTGAVSQVDGDRLTDRPVTGTTESLQGLMPGVTITRGSGSPGQEDYNIQIRGVTSVNNNPVLVLINGVEGNINNIRPEDIESISVLKDAAAASIYGSKAAGGVILVSTKKGKAGGTKVEYNAYTSASKIGLIPGRLHTWDMADLVNTASLNAGRNQPFSEEDIAKLKDPNFLWEEDPAHPNNFLFYGDYDLRKLALNDFGIMQSHNIAVHGGNEKTTFRVSGTFFQKDGILKIGYDSNTRYNGMFNLNNKIGKHLELSNIVSYSRNTVKKPSAVGTATNANGLEKRWGYFGEIFDRTGVSPFIDPNGNYTIGSKIGGYDTRTKLAKFTRDAGKSQVDQNNLRINSTLTINDLVKGLRLRAVGAINANFNNSFWNSAIVRDHHIDGTGGGYISTSGVEKGNTNTFYKEFQFLADYDLELGKHAVHLLGGYSTNDYRLETFSTKANDLVNDDLPSLSWASNVGLSSQDRILTSAHQSVFGRVNYNYDERYLLEGDLRYDGSSELAPENRYHVFPALSAAWRLSKESWFNVPFINELKIRGSWGQLGNEGVLGYYDYIPLLKNNDNGLILSNTTSLASYIYQQSLASKSISWETVETLDGGIDMRMLNNRLSLTVDYFTKRNKNMLAAVAYPDVIGVNVPNLNAGEMKTWGWEADITWKNHTDKFNYWFGVNVSDAQNELTKYYGADVLKEGTVKLLNGYPINSIFGYKTDGFFQTQEEVDGAAFQNSLTAPGDVKYVDLNGDGKIDPGNQTKEDHGDLVYLGNTNPRYNFGINAGFNWNNFDFSVFFQGVGKRTFELDQSLYPFHYGGQAPKSYFENHWTPENPDALWPRLYLRSNKLSNFWTNDRYTQNAAYVRLKNIQLAYTLQSGLLDRIGIEKFRVYLAGKDLWETSKTFSFIDPESPNGSVWMYPFSREFSLGVNVSFK